MSRVHGSGLTALDSVSLTVPRGRFLAVMGSSARQVHAAMRCAVGSNGRPPARYGSGALTWAALKPASADAAAAGPIGFVFQSLNNLVSALDVRENVALPLPSPAPAMTRAARSPVSPPWDSPTGRATLPEALGGQRQRVAIARALVTV